MNIFVTLPKINIKKNKDTYQQDFPRSKKNRPRYSRLLEIKKIKNLLKQGNLIKCGRYSLDIIAKNIIPFVTCV